MKTRIKKNLLNKDILIYILVTIIFFGIFLKTEYALDSYATYTFGIKELYNQFSACGRFIIIIAGIFIKLLNISDRLSYLLSYALAMTCMILSQYKLYKIVSKDVKDKKMQIIIPTLLVLNVFSIELFLFIEKGIMLFSVFVCVCALECVINYFEAKEKKQIVLSMAYMLLANFSYQGVVGFFVALALIYIIKYSKTTKEFFVNNIIVAVIYGIPSLIDYLLIKMLTIESRIGGKIVIIQSIKKIIKSTINMMINTYEILPKYLYLGFVIFITIIILINMHRKKETKMKEIAKLFYIYSGIIIATIFPQIMQNTESIWFVPRSTYSFAALLGVLILYLYINNYNIKSFEKNLILFIAMIVLITQFYSFNKISIDRYKLNAIDYEITTKIYENICEYENTTGNKIEKLAVYHDKSLKYSYDGIFATGDTNIKAYAKDWGIIYILKYYYNIDLYLTNIDNEKQEKFEQEDWSSFDKDQLIFEGNTLHLCVF